MIPDPNNTADPADEIPPELQALAEQMQAQDYGKRLESIGRYVAKCRDEAVKGRKFCGIEEIWEEDEEYYQGIDDANRTTHTWLKSPTTSGGLTSQKRGDDAPRCTSFFNITAHFTDSASARMGDILLPAGDWNFKINPSPVQDDQPPVQTGAVMPQGIVSPPDQTPATEQPTQPDLTGQPGTAPIQPQPAINPRQSDAEKRAEKGELWIQDKLVECSYHAEARNVIEDAARLGTGIIKGPFPDKVKTSKATQTPDGYTLEVVEETTWVSRSVDPRDFFPDPACGENIQNGSYTLERDRFTVKQLRGLKGTKGYHSDLIDKVLDEGPSHKNYTDGGMRRENTAEDDTFEIFYFYGEVDANDLEGEGKESEKKMVPGIVTLVNDTAIKAVLDPLDSGTFPYDVMVWRRIPGCWYGIGIPRQGRTPQAMINSAFRAEMDNMGLSASPQIIIRDGCVFPADGKWVIAPHKVWRVTENAESRSLGDFFAAINIPCNQVELANIIDQGFKAMEDATGIAYLLQGQQGSAPDTVGGMELLHKNASAILRRLARVFDERVTEPHIRRWYAVLLLHGPEEAKGDMKIEAVGSTALVEREIQSMESMVLLQLAANPIYGLDPAAAMGEVLRTKRFDLDKWQLSDQKKQQMASQPPMIPAVEVAKIRAATEEKRMALDQDIATAGNRLNVHKVDVDTDRDAAYVQAMAQRDQTNAEQRMQELQIKRELAMLDYANKRDMTLDKVKSDLARESMRLSTQKEMAGLAQVTTPLVEPPGRAVEGHAYEQ